MRKQARLTFILAASSGALLLLASPLAWRLFRRVRRYTVSRKRIDPELAAAIMIAVQSHRAFLREHTRYVVHPRHPDSAANPWVAAGRAAQHRNWPPRAK
jgi:hypothetical protein